MTRILACDCKDCTHWEIVQTADSKTHLHCKTCGRRDELDSFTVHERPGSKMRWIERSE